MHTGNYGAIALYALMTSLAPAAALAQQPAAPDVTHITQLSPERYGVITIAQVTKHREPRSSAKSRAGLWGLSIGAVLGGIAGCAWERASACPAV